MSAADCRRPLTDEERPHLAKLGVVLRTLRHDAGLSRTAAAVAAQLDPRHLGRLEQGTRRTRASTLDRIATVYGTDLASLTAVAGPALADESAFVGRVERRRARRLARRARVETPSQPPAQPRSDVTGG